MNKRLALRRSVSCMFLVAAFTMSSVCGAQEKDTSIVTKAADSLAAQVKAPIVQIPVTLKSLIIPGTLFAYGTLTDAVPFMRRQNTALHDVIWEDNPHQRHTIENYTLLIPAAAVYGLNIAGIKGQNNLVDRSIIYGMANGIANGIVGGLKAFKFEQRPDSADYRSFPSGHTAEAFVSAEFLHQEYKGRVHWTVIAAGYTVAVFTGYMRMYNNKHWFGDVVAGAGVGIVSTRFAYYLYPVVKHVLFGSRKLKAKAMIMPTWQSGAVGLAGVLQF